MTKLLPVYMAVIRLKRRDAVMMALGVTAGILLSVLISPSPQNCIALTKRMLFSSETNFSQLLSQPGPAPEENNFELKRPLFVAVVVPREPSTTASAIESTWGSGLHDLELFTVRRLAGDSAKTLELEWDDARLVYRVLALLYDKYTDHRYNWFIVVGEDTYVRVNTALQVLANLNPEDPLFVRRDGMAKLKLTQKKQSPSGSNDRSCAPSTGLVFSRGLLKHVAPVVEECLEEEGAASWALEREADMERCVSRKLGARCLWNHELPVRCGLCVCVSACVYLRACMCFVCVCACAVLQIRYTLAIPLHSCILVYVIVIVVFVHVHTSQTEQLFVDAGAPGDSVPSGALTVHGVQDPAHMRMLHHSYLKIALNASEALTQTLRSELSKESS